MKNSYRPAASVLSSCVLTSVLALTIAGCAGVERPQASLQPAAEDRAFLVTPSRGYPLAISPAEARQVDEAFESLIAGGDRGAVLSVSQQMLSRNPAFHPATLLAAQVAFSQGDTSRSVTLLEGMADELSQYPPWQLLLGRSAEKQNDLVLAHQAYYRVAEVSQAARTRSLEIQPRVVQILAQRIDDDLRRGRVEEATEELARLEAWAPDQTRTLESAAAVSRAKGDARGELEALRRLSARQPGSSDLAQRQAALELEAGDAGAGLRIFQELAAENPTDEQLQDQLARARFMWRLQLLPIEARDLAGRTALSRAEFAAMLYWLFPEVRYGQVGQARIASDVLDHQYREEIVRIVNLGVMSVDESLHQFSPEKPLARIEALSSMIRLLLRRQPPLACLGGLRPRDTMTVETTCGVSVSCGLLDSAADCLPSVGVSGSEAVELSRLTLNLLGISQ